MCGRYTIRHSAEEVAGRFSVQQVLFDPGIRYNVAPQSDIAVILAGGQRRERMLDGCRWGLVPSWARDAAIGARMINARGETVAEKPSFRRLLANRRCVIPADGFYEWRKAGRVRDPYHILLRDGGLFGIAGLWDEWQAPDGSPLRTCTIITTAGNEVVAPVHDRMPLILARGASEDRWLDPNVKAVDALMPLLVPYPASEMRAVPVSRRANSPANDDPSVLEPDVDGAYPEGRGESSLFP
jgi:putative SOS response-associated peptidase YedK